MLPEIAGKDQAFQMKDKISESDLEKLASGAINTQINPPSELKDSIKELNNDEMERNETNMSGVDKVARLGMFEQPSILAMDALVMMGMLPQKCMALTRQKKRLSISLNGEGRKEIVDLVRGKNEQDARKSQGLWDRLKNVIVPNQPQ